MNELSLTTTEQNALLNAERRIEQGMSSFMDVADALGAIKEGKLYREEYKTFAEYCETRWNFTKTYANNIINSAGAVKNLPSDLTTIVVKNESVAREVARIEPARREEVVRAAVSTAKDAGRKITARDIAEASKPRPERIETIAPEVDRAAKSFKYIPNEAEEIWLLSKANLDRILAKDISRERILRQVIAYCENRLKQNR